MGEAMSWERDYLALVRNTINNGHRAESRAGATRAVPGAMLSIPLDQGFPLLTTRKMFPAGVFGELAGFVRGAEDLATYEKYGCKYWRDNAAAWSENAGKPESEWRIGTSYGSLWRNFDGVDQLAGLLASLRNDPSSRRHIVTAWHPAAKACLPSCHILFQMHVMGNDLHCNVYMRSVDLCVGLPSDIVLYALLTELIAKDVGLRAKSLTFFLGNTHVYENHMATFLTQMYRLPHRSPRLVLASETSTLTFEPQHVKLEGYTHGEPIKYAFNA